ncbi:MAG: response regulator, partial [Caldimonas sp.]
ITLERRLIVVVEDEPVVRAGLEVLLRGWGATVESFGSVGAAEAWIAGPDRLASRPALVIVDYRLEHGRNGVEAIAALRQRFGTSLPAIVVTGSTTSALESEAQAHNFHLLIKPVLPNKLRAMISFKLAATAVESEASRRAV